MSSPEPFAAPLVDPSGWQPWRWFAAIWLVTWPLRGLWTTLLVAAWALAELDGRPGFVLDALQASIGVGLVAGGWVVCASLAPRYVLPLVFGATLHLGLVLTGRLEAYLGLVGTWVDIAAAVALRSALRRLGRPRLAAGAWPVLVLLVAQLATWVAAQSSEPGTDWGLVHLGVSGLIAVGMLALLGGVVAGRATS